MQQNDLDAFSHGFVFYLITVVFIIYIIQQFNVKNTFIETCHVDPIELQSLLYWNKNDQ